MSIKKIPQQESRNKLRISVQGSPTITASPHTFAGTNVQGCKYVNCFPVELPQLGSDPIRVVNKAPNFLSSASTMNVNQAGPLGAIGWSTMGQVVQWFDTDNAWVAQNAGGNSYIGGFSANLMTPYVNMGATSTLGPVIKVYNQAGVHTFFWLSYNSGTSSVILNSWAYGSSTVQTNTYTVASTGMTNHVLDIPPVYMNNRVYFLDPSTNTIFNTDPINGAPTFTVGSFIIPQIMADNFCGLFKYRNHLCALGNKSIEFFYDGGLSLGSPLVRQEQYLIVHGGTSVAGSVLYGDILYFLGLSESKGWGLYEVANFNLRKVSPPGIDALINNFDDPTGNITISNGPFVPMNVVDVYGHAHIVMTFVGTSTNSITQYTVNLVFEIPKRPYGIMAPTDGQWWEWPDLNTNISTLYVQANSTGLGVLNTYPMIFHGFASPNTTSTAGGIFAINCSFVMTYPTNTTISYKLINKDRSGTSGTSSTGTIITDVLDFDENQWKHIEYVDSIGDFGNNSITLSYTTDPTYQSANWVSTYAQTQTTIGPKNALRWHNLGPTRQMAFRIDMTGTSNVVFKGNEVSFNMGTI